MRYRKLDENYDMMFGNQQADFYRDTPEAPGQAIMTRLRLLSGEWYIDVTVGVPYQGGVLGKHTKDTADLVIRDAILNTQGVMAIVSYESSFNGDTREYTVSGTADTVYGLATFSGVV